MEKQIRKRKSYQLFKRMFNAGSTKKVLTTMYETLNEAKYFGSAMHANWAKEALELLIKDVNL